MLEIVRLTLGPVQTNCYLVADPQTAEAAVIDPAWDGGKILAAAAGRGWRIGHLWYTHAHFDHIGGAAAVADALNPPPLVAMHPADHGLWQTGGGGAAFGFRIDPGPEPSLDLDTFRSLKLGGEVFEVRLTPGHTPGSVVFYCPAAGVLFSGDTLFQGSVGRTDLPGADGAALLAGIRAQIFSLPDGTRVLSGHGPETTVGEERRSNPFVID
jgi:glyoxylase-like metal-dependent hydrolase (beta-lactamase superfamily II)